MREALLSCGRPHGNTVKQDLVAGRAQQHPAPAAVLQRLPQLLPSRVKLRRGLGVAKLIQARKLQENVQTADKRARSGLCFRTHSGVSSSSNGPIFVLSTFPGRNTIYISFPLPPTQASPHSLYSSQ